MVDGLVKIPKTGVFPIHLLSTFLGLDDSFKTLGQIKLLARFNEVEEIMLYSIYMSLSFSIAARWRGLVEFKSEVPKNLKRNCLK